MVRHLKAGNEAHLEIVELDLTLRWDDESVPCTLSLHDWSRRLHGGLERAGRSIRVDPVEIKQQLQDAGFVDIDEEVIAIPVSPWLTASADENASLWFSSTLTSSLFGLSAKPLIQYGDLTLEQLKELCERIKDELCDLQFHLIMNL